MSYGGIDKQRQSGFVRINGKQVLQKKSGSRGFTLVRINSDCSVNNISTFDTHARFPHTGNDRIKEYLGNLPNNTRIAGITFDEFTLGLKNDAKSALNSVGLDLSTASYRSSLCFTFITGKPQDTKQSQATAGNGPSMLSIKF